VSERARRPRITLVIPSLTSGGAERVMVDLATQLADSWTVTLLTTEGRDRDFYALPGTVARVALDLPSPSARKLDILRFVVRVTFRLRREIAASRPDVVLSFMEITNILVLLAATQSTWPVVVAERTDPRHHRVSAVWERLRRMLYPRAAAVVVQTESVQGWARSFLPDDAVHVIPNAPRDVMPSDRRPADMPPGHAIVAVGRLGPEKGIDVLLDAAARALASRPDWTVVLVGDGPSRAALEARASEADLSGRVRFIGRVANPEAYLQAADLYVLPSRYEGFPNALLEAMGCGLPVIATDCPSGPAEMIRDGVDGRLVPPGDAPALASVIGELADDAAARQRLGSRAPEVHHRFSRQSVLERWNGVLHAARVAHRGAAMPAAPALSRGRSTS
jgi:GalNAc-alpha-(1->4)-GalNAc-alpha-(1->3)-diNAcBac-PP-undecaprenol alpha-1,4-N-acetyl-D-galactosaminyltransferase